MRRFVICAAAAAAVIGLFLFAVPSMKADAAAVAAEEHMNDTTVTNISIPSGTTAIGTRAYYGCSNLMSVIIPDGVTSIGESAFAMCPQLAYVQIPSSVKTIAPGAFAGDGALSYLAFNGSNNNFIYSDGVLYSPSSNEIISYLPGNRNVEYKMPSSVTAIDKYAFWGANYLNKVTVSDGVKTISPYDFAYCSGLKYIFLPSSVRSLQEYSFRDCISLEAVYAEDKAIKIDPTAFYNCRSGLSTVSGASLIAFNQKAVVQEVPAGSQADVSKNAAAGTDNNDGSDISGNTAASSGNSNKESSGSDSTAETDAEKRARELTEKLSGPYRQNDTPGLIGSSYIVGGKAIVIINTASGNSK